jgi:hypothetical protein
MGEDHAVVVCCPGENLTCGLNRIEQLVSADGALGFWYFLAQSCSPLLYDVIDNDARVQPSTDRTPQIVAALDHWVPTLCSVPITLPHRRGSGSEAQTGASIDQQR